MRIPEPWSGLVLALATFRITRLVGWDDLSIPVRRWVTGLGDKQHHGLAGVFDAVQEAGLDPWDAGDMQAAWDIARQTSPELPPDPVPMPIGPARFYLSRLIRCPWCAGFWASVAVAVAYYASPHWTILAALPFALSTVVGLMARWLDP